MSQGDQQNPYVSPRVDADAAASGPALEKNSPRSKVSNIAGLILAMLGTAVFSLVSPKFFRIFAEFKLPLPMITLLALNAWFIYGMGTLFCGWFAIGLIVRSKRLSSAIGFSGLVCLMLAGMWLILSLVLPFVTLVNSLS
ncbi:MAG: hypothetical protein K8T25_17280 [Planctomycetia bacterium]|nr:hypothetical protein [Planctomycetia bacterium]